MHIVCPKNSGKLHTFKLENKDIITHIVAMKAKMNAYKTDDGKEKKTAKGIQKRQTNKLLTYDLFEKALADEVPETFKTIPNYRFMHKKNEITVVKCNKEGFNSYDDKRGILNDGIHTLAYGHWRLLLKQYEYSEMDKPFKYYFDKDGKMIRPINE